MAARGQLPPVRGHQIVVTGQHELVEEVGRAQVVVAARSPESAEAMSIVTSRRDSVGSSATAMAPNTPVKRPQNLLSMKWRSLKSPSVRPIPCREQGVRGPARRPA